MVKIISNNKKYLLVLININYLHNEILVSNIIIILFELFTSITKMYIVMKTLLYHQNYLLYANIKKLLVNIIKFKSYI